MGVDLFARSHYVSVNWGCRLIGLPLMIAVLAEVFAAVFRPYSTLPKGTVRWFSITFVSLVLLTTVASVCFPGSAPGDWMNTILVLNRSASLIFCGAFGFTALFSSYFGIPWQQRTYGIGVGFLLFMSVDLFTSSLSATYGVAVFRALRDVSMLAYTLALITWVTYFVKPDISSRPPTLEQLRRLQKALDYSAKKVESFRGTN
jgi:ABC-type transport system involved in multi-copper enzyme maturation permease subunit